MYGWIQKLTLGKGIIVCRWLKYIPRPLAIFLCFCISRFLYFVSSDLRKLVYNNMKDLLTDVHPRKIRRLVRSYFYQMTSILYEILIESASLEKLGSKRFKVMGEEYVEQALEQGRGVIVFAPHIGNFFYYYWYLTRKFNCLTVATAGSSELRPIYLLFENMGCQGLDYDEIPSVEIVKQLKRHLEKNGVVFLLSDFWRPKFPPARFFGRPTRSPSGAAMLSLEGKVPIIPMLGYRTNCFEHVIQFSPPVSLYEKWSRTERLQATNELNQIMEKGVRLKPSQWFYWFNVHERWENKDGG